MATIERRREEFYCDSAGGGCGKYFITYLRENFSGQYTFCCPNCGHHHFRIVKKGLITCDRHDNRTLGSTEIIMGLKATIRDTPWHDDPDFKRSQLKVYNNTALSPTDFVRDRQP